MSYNNSKPPVEHDHSLMVARLAKPGGTIKEQMTAREAHLIHMAMGVSGEAGELLDGIKKVTIYKKPIDRDNIIEELGDLEFYMEGLRAALGINREETLSWNMEKLAQRYKSQTYTDADAQARADKA